MSRAPPSWRLLCRPRLSSLFSSKVYYKVVPPSERNELNLSFSSSARNQKLELYQRISAGRWRIFPRFSVFDREIIRPGSHRFLFAISKSVLQPCSISWSCVQLGPLKKTDIIEPPFHSERVHKPKACLFYCSPFAIFVEDLVNIGFGLLEISRPKKMKKKDWHKSSATTIDIRLTNTAKYLQVVVNRVVLNQQNRVQKVHKQQQQQQLWN